MNVLRCQKLETLKRNKMSLTPAMFEPIKAKFIKFMSEELFLKEASFAAQHLNKNSYLAGSTPDSILQSVLNVAQIGISLNPALKLAYLVPRRVNNEIVCCLEPSYQGLCKLATDTGSVKNIYAHLIYENDEFQQILGTENSIIHKPKLGNRGDIIGVYAVAVLSDNRTQVEVMDKLAIFEIRDLSESYKAFKNGKTKSCIWEDNFDEMSRKTVIKRLCKYLPKTEYWEKLEQAIELTNEDFKIDYWQGDKIEQLMRTSAIDNEEKEWIMRSLNTYTKTAANNLILRLENSQVNPIQAGEPYNQTKIKETLRNQVG